MENPNSLVIAEFRANAGQVTQALGGALAGLQLVLLHHVGRKTGRRYVTPVSYMPHEGGFLLLGSAAGSPIEPQWVANIEAMQEMTAEFGGHSVEVTPTVLRDGPERDRLYAVENAHWPFVQAYEAQTTRRFPVVRLTPVAEGRA